MTNEELVNWCIEEVKEKSYLIFPDELFLSIDTEQAKFLSEKLSNKFLIKLPRRETEFFEWLKINDESVWNDLWANDTLEYEPYIVSIAFLPLLIDKSRGFPICDLLSNDNYYFTHAQIVDEESKIMIESAKEIFLANKPLTVAQLLALEISFAPIDIWRFSYNHKIDLDKAKNAVTSLVEDGVLIHLKDASHLANFIDI